MPIFMPPDIIHCFSHIFKDKNLKTAVAVREEETCAIKFGAECAFHHMST
jgi:hypothetical protein